jgi:3-oxoacyl-(acyl-carrier-protein) synthase
MAWAAARQAQAEAGIRGVFAPARIGVAVGTSRGPSSKLRESFEHLGSQSYPPSLAAHSTFGAVAGALAQALELKGPAATMAATCASAAFAIGFAAEQILLGKADCMLAGGAEAPIEPFVLAQLHAAGVLASHAEARLACRPFSATRTGLVAGEGSAFLCLESAASARSRGVSPLAYLSGWAYSLDDSGRTGVQEDGSDAAQAMREALEVAGIHPEDVDYINAHGTGTRLNDPAEARAVASLFGPRAASIPCSSTKPVTGHCLGATPALEAVLCIESLRRQVVLPTANCPDQDTECAINAETGGARPAALRNALSNSLGFWGYRAALVFTR